MVYMYKNLLIVERNEPVTSIKNFVKNRLRVWFNDDSDIWCHKSSADKIVIIYGYELWKDDNIRFIDKDFNFTDTSYIGYIKMYCKGPDIKVYDFRFTNLTCAKKYFAQFKEYLISSIKQIKLFNSQIDKANFCLHWDKRCYSSTLEHILKGIGLLSKFKHKNYKFTSIVVNPKLNNYWTNS